MYYNTGYGRNHLLSSPLTHLDVISCYNLSLIVATIILNFLCFVNVGRSKFEITGIECEVFCRKGVDKECKSMCYNSLYERRENSI